jgi:hypothetical protein
MNYIVYRPTWVQVKSTRNQLAVDSAADDCHPIALSGAVGGRGLQP